jgi:hypothetical protein
MVSQEALLVTLIQLVDRLPLPVLATQHFALGAIFVYHLTLLYRFEHDLELCFGLKAA